MKVGDPVQIEPSAFGNTIGQQIENLRNYAGLTDIKAHKLLPPQSYIGTVKHIDGVNHFVEWDMAGWEGKQYEFMGHMLKCAS